MMSPKAKIALIAATVIVAYICEVVVSILPWKSSVILMCSIIVAALAIWASQRRKRQT